MNATEEQSLGGGAYWNRLVESKLCIFVSILLPLGQVTTLQLPSFMHAENKEWTFWQECTHWPASSAANICSTLSIFRVCSPAVAIAP